MARYKWQFNKKVGIHYDYVWLTTDWLCTTLPSITPTNQPSLKIIEGVVGICQHTPQTSRKKNFESNVYGSYAYDTVWAVANTIDTFLNQETNMSFSFFDSKFGKLKIFDNGKDFVKILSETNFNGLTGQIQFNTDRNLVPRGYEIVNFVKLAIQNVGYWSNHSGLSIVPPESLKVDKSKLPRLNEKLGVITWPGGNTDRPRGWVIGDQERPLRIGIPKRASFVEFVTELSNHTIQGYCIDVFTEAVKLIPYQLPFRFVPFGDGEKNPNYDLLVKSVTDDVSIRLVKSCFYHVLDTYKYVSSTLYTMRLMHSKSGALVVHNADTLYLMHNVHNVSDAMQHAYYIVYLAVTFCLIHGVFDAMCQIHCVSQIRYVVYIHSVSDALCELHYVSGTHCA